MTNRISQHYKDKKNSKRGRGIKFNPHLNEWKEACRVYCYDTQIVKHFDISKETFYTFLDKQRYEKEQGRPSEFFDSYKQERNTTKQNVLDKLLRCNEPAALIFSAKAYGGLKEAKDAELLILKRKELMLKHKEFLSKIAERYNLNYEELKELADKFFKNIKIDDM